MVKSVGLSRAKKLQLGSECEAHSQAGCMLSVEELPRFPTTMDEIVEEEQEASRLFERVIAKAVAQGKKGGVRIEPHVVAGHTVPTIVEFIDRGGFDLLVIGYMGHSALYNRLIGSTTDRLVELAPCAVLVVK